MILIQVYHVVDKTIKFSRKDIIQATVFNVVRINYESIYDFSVDFLN